MFQRREKQCESQPREKLFKFQTNHYAVGIIINHHHPVQASLSSRINHSICHFPSQIPIYNSLLTVNASIIGFSNASGFVVLAHRLMTFPSFPINHFSKFHLTLFIPNNPGFSFFNHSKSGFAASPFTSVLPMIGKETP